MRFVILAVIGLVVAFLIQAILPAAFSQLVNQRILEAAGWSPGTTPPTNYMIFSVTARMTACVLAGIAAALIVGRARFRHALAYGALFATLAGWANRATLLNSPHPYEWPLILAPLLAMPVGAWLVMKARPLTIEGGGEPVAS